MNKTITISDETYEAFKTQIEKMMKAEKPKLRHGDFGCFKDGTPRICIMDSIYDEKGRCGKSSDIEYYTIFGNIFDLMEGWGKPFERFGLKKQNDTEFYFHIESTGRKEVAFKLNHQGKWFYANEAELEEIWHNLGHALMELKRKENKCS